MAHACQVNESERPIMVANHRVNKGKTRTVGTRYPMEKIALLDRLAHTLGMGSRAELIADALDEKLERHGMLPPALKRVA